MQSSKVPSAYRAAPRAFMSSAPRCPRCDKAVYAAEQVLGPGGREYHKPCLTCVSCKKTVGPGSFQDHEGDPYCKHCYSKNFGPKGYGHGGVMTGDYHDPLIHGSPNSRTASARTSWASNPGTPSRSAKVSSSATSTETASPSRNTRAAAINDEDPEGTVRLAKQTIKGKTSIESPMSVYERQRLRAGGQDSEDEGDDLDSRLAGSLGTGLSLGAAVPERQGKPDEPSSRPDSPPQLSTSRPSSPIKNGPLLRSESPASSSGTAATASTANTSTSEGLRQVQTGRQLASSTSTGGLAGYKSNLGLLNSAGKDLCRRCSTPVYFAEKVVAGGHKWHKRCLRCVTCSKALDSHLVERDNLPYCKRCYDETWGIRSQGFVLTPSLH